MELTAEAVPRLVRIVEYIEKAADRGPIDPVARIECIDDYVRLCSLYPDQPIDSYKTSNVTGKLYKVHLPANPEGFLGQLILPLITQRDPVSLRALLATLNDCLADATVHPRVKLNVLNVENALVRQSVISGLQVGDLALAQAFCDIRRTVVLGAIDNPLKYFTTQDAALNQPILNSLYRLYVDTERDLFLRHGIRDAIIPLFEEALTATRERRDILAEVLRSGIAANQRATLITAEAMREKLDLYRETLDGEQMGALERAIEYGGEQGVDIRGLTIQLANATFRGTSPGEIYTVIQFVIPLEPRDAEARREGTLADGRRFVIAFRRVNSVYEDPAITYLNNIGSERIGGLPSTFLSDVNPRPQANATLVLMRVDGCLALDFDVAGDGTISDKLLEDERALRGGQYYPHKELAVGLLREIYRGAPDQCPLQCDLHDLHVDAFSNFLVDYYHSGAGIVVHRKSYLLTSRDAFLRACTRYSDQIGEVYRRDKSVSIRALLDNSIIRTNESLRDFIYKALELCVKAAIEQHGCWDLLWEGNPRQPKRETDAHRFINSCMRPILEMKGIRLSREVVTANGAVDFFCSYTSPRNEVLKVCIEVKNAHGGVEHGVATQLPAYMNGEQPSHGIYVVLWYRGADWSKPETFDSIEALSAKLDALKPTAEYRIDVMVVNCSRPVPPSRM
jgi:hypothetical protein